MHWQDQGTEPDYRFSLANERTFLAWIRTALAILAGAVLLHQFAGRLEPGWIVRGLAVATSACAALLGGGAYLRWKGNEIAMRHNRPLPPSKLLLLVAVLSGGIAAAVAVILAVQ